MGAMQFLIAMKLFSPILCYLLIKQLPRAARAIKKGEYLFIEFH